MKKEPLVFPASDRQLAPSKTLTFDSILTGDVGSWWSKTWSHIGSIPFPVTVEAGQVPGLDYLRVIESLSR